MLNLKRNGSAIELVFPFLFLLTLQLLFTQAHLIDIFIKTIDYPSKVVKPPLYLSSITTTPFAHHDYTFRPSRLYLSFITTIPFALIFHYRTKKEVNTNYRYLPPNSLYI